MDGAALRGTDLARRLYKDEVLPILDGTFPGLAHAAGRLGTGSDVLGFDDSTSRDHDWGCRLSLLLPDERADLVRDVDEVLERSLPTSFLGHPVRVPTSREPRARHRVEVATVGSFVRHHLGIDLAPDPTALDWLVLTGQSVLEVVAGPVFADHGTGLTDVRERLAWYPHDVWLHVLAAGWSRVGQELPLVGRTADRGDDVGSRVLTARLCRDLVHLAFLTEGRWPPYPKWVGVALAELPVGRRIEAGLAAALTAGTWQGREGALVAVATELHRHQRTLGLTDVDGAIGPFWDRPYRSVRDEMVRSLLDQVEDPAVRALPDGVGSIEQWVDDVAVLSRPERRSALRLAYQAMLRQG